MNAHAEIFKPSAIAVAIGLGMQVCNDDITDTGEVADVFEKLREAHATTTELVDAIEARQAIEEESGPWVVPGMRENFAILVGLPTYSPRKVIEQASIARVKAAITRARGNKS